MLFDADGVLQVIPGGWYAAMEPYLGERARQFLHQTWKDELPTLAGNGDYLPMLAATLLDYGVAESVEVVYRDVWQRIKPVEESFAIVEALRRNGYGVHLGTNQEQHRGSHMRAALGYDDASTPAATPTTSESPSRTPRSSSRPPASSVPTQQPFCSSTTARGTSKGH